MKKYLLIKTLLVACFLLALDGATKAYADELTDVITPSSLGTTGNSYVDVTFTGQSGTGYLGHIIVTGSYIQLNNSSSTHPGIVTTSSVGYVRKVVVAWNTSSSRVLNIYGSNEAYSSATDLYSSVTRGTLLGTIDHSAGETELSISEDYAYLGIISSYGAIYLSEIDITWDTGDGGGTEPEPAPSGHGYEPDDPYTASEAIELAQDLDSSTTIAGVYVTGIISQIDEISTTDGNATYYISDDGTTDHQLEIYRGYYLDGARFTSEEQIKVSDTVVVYGDLVDYDGNTPALTSGNKLYSINGSTEAPDTGGDSGDGGDDDDGDEEGGISGTVTHGSSMITLTNLDVSAGTETATFDVASITDLGNGTFVDGTEFELSDGSTFVCAKGDSSSSPSYYNNKTLRIYYNNTITFTCKQKIAKIEMTTESSEYEGSNVETVVFSADGTIADFCNVRDGKETTQLRITYITVYYAEEGATGTFSISSAGYATYYTADEYRMPRGVVGTTVTGVESQAADGGYILDMAWGYEAGTTVPAGTALVLKGEAATYTYTITATDAAAVEDNLLLGAVEDTMTYGPLADEEYFFYELTNGEHGIGFYWANADGSAFTSAAHKAWLPLTTAQAANAKFLAFGETESSTTGIIALPTATSDGDAIYTLQGVRVADMTKKGIYIVGGRKVLVK